MTLQKFLEQATNAYNDGKPTLTDVEYDILEAKLASQLLVDDKAYIPHLHRMYSLNKHYPEKDGVHELQNADVVRSAKLDGLACSVLYAEGQLVQVLTRGDGIVGRPITDKAGILLKEKLPLKGLIQVTGELVADINVPNSRNAASGSFNLLEGFEARAKEIGLTFIAYDIVGDVKYETYTQKMKHLAELGFNTILTVDTSKYPLDGEVLRLDNENSFAKLGYTDKFPRGAIALKTVSEIKSTKLLDVIWQTGSSGRITPVAILEPVELGGAIVSRATLNNIAYIKALGISIGDYVDVVRAGEIIPKIVGITAA